ncbi:glycosyltransferase family 2 protein [Anatilimnocola sp. NA78]|uniref:glycosyltransferase family 2 protein n=1 Tax=Anatilimnocola sp. NA78 TaxID=3415683 RepID=UPI003CE46536
MSKTPGNTLSLIMPVRDCEATLGRQVARWLEIIPELTQRFELLIVDDGSNDHTFETAEELARQYPQVRALRNTVARGTQQAVRTGLEQARGEIVFVQDEQAAISSNDLRRLWEMRQNQQLVMARTPSRVQNLSKDLLEKLSTWGEALKQQANETNQLAAIHMIRRGAIEELRSSTAESEMTLGKIPPMPATAVIDPASTNHSRTDANHQGGAPRRASFLSHLRELALGE